MAYNLSVNKSNVIKVSFKEQMLQAREDAIIQAVNGLLAERGFDAMTVDQVAANVGIAKASLYKHFPSKEDLAAAAMTWVMQRTLAFLATLPPNSPPQDNLKDVVRWPGRCLRCPAKTPACAPAWRATVITWTP